MNYRDLNLNIMQRESTHSYALIMPQSPDDAELVRKIDHQTFEDIRLLYRIYLKRDWECNTVAFWVFADMIRLLHDHVNNQGAKVFGEPGNNVLDFYGLLNIGASMKRNSRAEKSGNLNVTFIPGDLVADILEDDTKPENQPVKEPVKPKEKFKTGDEMWDEMMARIGRMAMKELSEHHNMIIPDHWLVIATAHTFLVNIYKTIAFILANGDDTMAMVNFNDLIEFIGQKNSDGTVQIYANPGMNAKLQIKSDSMTESDDTDDFYDDDY